MQKNKIATTIEDDLLHLQGLGKTTSLSIKEVLSILYKKGYLLTILLLNLPFCQPLQIPGLSVPFGLAIAFLALKMIFGRHIWLPQKILAKTIPPDTLQKIVDNILWLIRKIKRWTYPRLILLCQHPVLQIFNAVLIFILGLCLAMPLPIPFSNMIVAWAIFFIALGALENDGVLVIVGYIVSLLAFVFFAATIIINWKILTYFFPSL
jgi:hypothetical protein